jgi:hypothetical protein
MDNPRVYGSIGLTPKRINLQDIRMGSAITFVRYGLISTGSEMIGSSWPQ